MYEFLLNILNKLSNNGFEAYIVGGFVRDSLLNIETNDIDICTSAKLDDLTELFKDAEVFSDYWAIKLKYEKYTININTYRKELSYYKNKPVKIEFALSLEEDLKRRDFTINSLCFDKNFNLIDIFNSKKDLDNKLIRVIGNTKERLDEDKTRILRAIRLSCLLNLTLDDEIIDYIKNNRNLLKFINANKYKEELDKIIIGNKFDKLLSFIRNNDLNDIFKFDDIVIINSIEGIYSQLNMPSNYPFTRKEKKLINEFKKIISLKELTDKDILKLGLNDSLIVGKIIGLNKGKIEKRYETLKNVFKNK